MGTLYSVCIMQLAVYNYHASLVQIENYTRTIENYTPLQRIYFVCALSYRIFPVLQILWDISNKFSHIIKKKLGYVPQDFNP